MKQKKWIAAAAAAVCVMTGGAVQAQETEALTLEEQAQETEEFTLAEQEMGEEIKGAHAMGKADAQKENLTKVTLNEVAHSIFYAPQYVAIELGYFEEEGIDLELVTGFGADKVMTALLSGEADIGFMGSEASIYTYAGGAADAPVNFAQLTQRAGNFLVSREPMEAFSWQDLVGEEVLGGRRGVASIVM